MVETSKLTGWERVRHVFWDAKEFTMERSLSKWFLKVGFFTGFFTGGILGMRHAHERFDAHAAGKSFGSVANAAVS